MTDCEQRDEHYSAYIVPVATLSRVRNVATSLALAALSLAPVTATFAAAAASPDECSSRRTASAVVNTIRARHERDGVRGAVGIRAQNIPPAIAIPTWLGGRRADPTPTELAAIAARRRIAEEAVTVFQTRYVDADGVSWERMRRRVEQATLRNDAELESLIRWILSCAHDAYTRYLPTRELDGVRDGIEGAMMGVGIVFSAETRGWRRTQRVLVKHVVRGSPAHDAGLQRGDEIVAIDTHRVTSMRVDDAAARLAGTTRPDRARGRVLLTFVRRPQEDRELSVLLTRRRFSVPTVSHEIVTVPNVGDVAFLQVRDFAARTATHARRALFQAMAGGDLALVVIDLRGNAGGLVDQAVTFAKMMLPRGRTVVQFVGRGGATSVERTRSKFPIQGNIPIVVLADERTASASELVMAALRDNCVAVAVGTRTFGKGSVQAVVPLSDGAGVAVTVAAYRTPKGKRIADGIGLRPDWFRGDLAEDKEAVLQLFGRNAARRYRWIGAKLRKCEPPIVVETRSNAWWRVWRR